MSIVVIASPIAVPVAVPAPVGWLYGPEKIRHHALVAVDSERVEQMWGARKDPGRMGEIVRRWGSEMLAEVSEESVHVPQAAFDDWVARIEGVAPRLLPLVFRLDAAQLTRPLWDQVTDAVQRLETLRTDVRRVDFSRPELLMERGILRLEGALAAVAEPDRVGYAAAFESWVAVRTEALHLLARGAAPLGFSTDFVASNPGTFRRRLSPRVVRGHEPVQIVLRKDLQAWLETVRDTGDAEAIRHADRLAAQPAEHYLHCLTTWHQYLLATATPVHGGVFRRCPPKQLEA